MRLSRLFARDRIRLDRNEVAGAFGDLGTDLPLLVGMILASGADGSRILLVFGLCQIFSALAYGVPMPVQPLKAVAALVIAQQIAAPVVFGAGLTIGMVMLLLSLSGGLEGMARVIPKAVVRGLQLGLGLQLAWVALSRYVPAAGTGGLLLAAACVTAGLALRGNRRFPAALPILAMGLLYALAMGGHTAGWWPLMEPAERGGAVLRGDAIITGFLTLALAQIPLSLGNSILATRQLLHDCFPHRGISHRRIGLTYAAMNLAAPFLGGVPVCHGSGGVAGHYALGARTGGSVLIYGGFMLALAAIAGSDMSGVMRFLPLPMLGALLVLEGLALIRLTADREAGFGRNGLTWSVGLSCVLLPYGFLLGMLGGTLAHHGAGVLRRRFAPRIPGAAPTR